MDLSKFKGIFKVIGFIILLLVLLVITIFAGRTASNYFAKASSCPVSDVLASQVTANSAVVSWETEDVTQGRVEYGTNANSLTFSVPESTSAKIHSAPLTLLTPNTVYYYLVSVGDTRCDSTGSTCKGTCVPWSFTTEAVVLQEEIVAPLPSTTPTPGQTTTVVPTLTLQITSTPPLLTGGPSPTSGLSDFCSKIQGNIGKTSLMTAEWPNVKQYDIDGNGVINGLDVLKCQKEGK